MPVPVARSFVGISKEVSRGTGVASTYYLKVEKRQGEDVPKWEAVKGLRGAMAETYGMVQGPKSTIWSMDGPVFADDLGWPLCGILGDVTASSSRTVSDGVLNATTTVTSATAAFTAADQFKNISGGSIPAGAFIASVTNVTTIVLSIAATGSASGVTLTIGAPVTHVAGLLNSGSAQPTSQTLCDFYAITQPRQYAGIQWQELELSFSFEGLLAYTAKAMGLTPTVSISAPTDSFSALPPTPSWQGVATIGGTINGKIGDGKVTLTRKAELVPGMTGTQLYAAVFLGEMTAKYSYTAYIDDDTELNRMLNNTQPSVDLRWSSGTGANQVQVGLHMSQVALTKAANDYGKAFVQVKAEGELIANTTDVGSSGGYGLVSAMLGNNITAGTYV